MEGWTRVPARGRAVRSGFMESGNKKLEKKLQMTAPEVDTYYENERGWKWKAQRLESTQRCNNIVS